MQFHLVPLINENTESPPSYQTKITYRKSWRISSSEISSLTYILVNDKNDGKSMKMPKSTTLATFNISKQKRHKFVDQ